MVIIQHPEPWCEIVTYNEYIDPEVNKMKKKMVAAGVMMLAFLAACGKKAQITIDDSGVKTSVEVSVPEKVDKILEQAEITLGSQDSTDPALGTEIEDAAEIKVLRMNHVKISIDGELKEADHLGGTVKDLLQAEGITLGERQSMNVKEDDLLKDGMKIEIVSSISVKVLHDGSEDVVEDAKGTVEDVLKQLGVQLGEEDEISPAVDTAVEHGMEIVIHRVTYEEKKETEEIPFETERKDDSSLTKGEEKTETEGVNGERTVTIRVKLVDGKEESRETVSEEITKEPVNEVILVGTKKKEKATQAPSGKVETSRIAVPNCDDGSHGYYEIYYSDGSVEYVEY